MKTITLNEKRIFEKNHTTKYWRDIECDPQTVELKTWSSDHPLFVLKGKVVKSHDLKEIGLIVDCYVQTYSFLLQNDIDSGVYTINNQLGEEVRCSTRKISAF